MEKIIDIKHHFDDYECMWNGIEDIYMNKTGESLPSNFFFTLASLGSFCYLKTPKSELKRMIALGDGRTKKMYEFLAPIVGFEYKHHEYKSFEKALKKAKSEIDLGFPVVLGALDMFYLPYFENLYQKEHIPFHYVLMVGYNDKNQSIYLYDCGRLELISLSYDMLKKAMNCNYSGLSKENTVCTIRMNEKRNKIQIAKDALSIKKNSFLNPEAGFIGYKGFQKFINEIPTLREDIGKEEYDKILTNMVMFFGEVPTIPNEIKGINKPDSIEFKGRFDKIGDILVYLGEETKDDSWIKSSKYFYKCGQIISKISDIIIEYLCDKKDNTNLLAVMFTEVLNNMMEGYQSLNF